MGVIKWIEDDHTDTMGFLGKLHICTIEEMFNDHGHKWLVFHAAFPGHLPEYQPNHRFPCEDETVARDFAEGCLHEWLDASGLVFKPAAEGRCGTTQSPAAWMIAALAEGKPGIDIKPLRSDALKPYQKALMDSLFSEEAGFTRTSIMNRPPHDEPLDADHWFTWEELYGDNASVPMNGGYTYQRGVDSYMTKLSVDLLKGMAAQIDTAAAATRELDRRADAFGELAKGIPFMDRVDPEACRRRVIGPDGLWMWEVGGAA